MGSLKTEEEGKWMIYRGLSLYKNEENQGPESNKVEEHTKDHKC